MLANQIEIRFRDLDGHYSREIIPAQWCIGTETANVIDEIIAECTAVPFHSVKLFDPNRKELIQRTSFDTTTRKVANTALNGKCAASG